MRMAQQNSQTQSAQKAKIQVEGISKYFPFNGRNLPVLEKVDFFAEEGEFVSIIGPSGCGKSTLLNIIAGLDEPTEGSIWLDGGPARRRLGVVGYMMQKDLLLPWRTVMENAILGLEVQGTGRLEARRRAQELLERFGLRGFENQYPSSLSGGMRQRAAFLRTILVGQSIILLDEPFGALDAITRTHMQEWLMGVWESWGKTIVLVTHDVEEALLLSQRIYVLSESPGRVKTVLDVPLPWPRSYRLVTEDAFVQAKARLLASLRGGASIGANAGGAP